MEQSIDLNELEYNEDEFWEKEAKKKLTKEELEKKLAWYEMYFGERHPALDDRFIRFTKGEERTLIILSYEVDLIRRGEDYVPCLHVLDEDGNRKILLLNKKSLAIKIGFLMKKHEILRGLKVTIKAPNPDEGEKYYRITHIEAVDTKNLPKVG